MIPQLNVEEARTHRQFSSTSHLQSAGAFLPSEHLTYAEVLRLLVETRVQLAMLHAQVQVLEQRIARQHHHPDAQEWWTI